MIGYDNRGINHGVVLDLPFQEGVGLITHDLAKPRHIATLTGPPTWSDVHLIGPSDLGILNFDGATQYLQIPGADTLDLDFTGDFSLAAWVYPVYTAMSMVIMCRNTTGGGGVGCGWCMFLYLDAGRGNTLTLRTNQVGSHTDCWGAGFPDSEWQLVGYSRNSTLTTVACYKNGRPITTTPSVGILDPIACGAGNKLLVGCQQGEASAFYGGNMWRPRAWPWQLSDADWLSLWEHERHWFGV